LFLDGNDLGCEGALSLILKIADECELEVIRKEQEEAEKREAEAKRLEEEEQRPLWERTANLDQPDGDTDNKQKKVPEKKKKKSKLV
jgi:hypothetical protein